MRDDQFRKSRYGLCTTIKFLVDHNLFLCFHRISIQGSMKTFREFAEKALRNSESAGESRIIQLYCHSKIILLYDHNNTVYSELKS